MQEIINAAFKAAQSGGSTYQYYVKNAYWQAPLRHRMALLPSMIVADPRVAREIGLTLLNKVRIGYSTQRSTAEHQLPGIYDDFLSVVTNKNWLLQEPVHLFGSSLEEAKDIAQVYVELLKRVSKRGGKRPFSLLTKWLHQCFPQTFAIYDKNAARSVLTWSNQKLSHISSTDLRRLQFDVEASYWVKRWDDPGWYLGILNFYRIFWQIAIQQEASSDIENAAEGLQNILHSQPRYSHARMTPLQVLDGLLWQANGDTSLLGLT